MRKVLIVEDDRLINDGIKEILQDRGYKTGQVFSGRDVSPILTDSYDAILLDINLPGCDGFKLCQKVKETCSTPIIFITARDNERDIIKGFDLGADDYVIKPFSTKVLVKRIEAVIGRYGNKNSPTCIVGDLEYDLESQVLKKNGNTIILSATESKILNLLIKNRNRILTRNQLLELVWDIDGNFVDENALSVNISRLRKKIESVDGKYKYIKTVFGIGYKWSDE